ncbi:alpha/beta fold hydrolase [Bradyrhizobium sp. HKCCYLS20291]|uniref:alpha/beta fold hydrolase n=1 Tax=Bradyrhizobium sp. HKCCYLS20291 TaxID=3420766 RepID=UPI003EBC8E4E
MTSLDAVRWSFSLLDRSRRMQGDLLDMLGFGPRETPYRVQLAGSHWMLRDYGGGDQMQPVLIVAAPIKRPYIWDLLPVVSAIRRCLEASLHVYLLEWMPASAETADVGLAEYVRAIEAALAAIEQRSDQPRPILMGHSLGGTLATLFAAKERPAIAGLVLLGVPLCFGSSPFRDALMTLVPEHVPNLHPFPGSILSQASALISPYAFVWSRLLAAGVSGGDPFVVDIQTRIERWALDEIALPGRLVSEVVELLYKQDCFRRGILQIGASTIGPERISAPVLAIANAADPVAPLSSVSPIRDVLGAGRFQIIVYPGERGIGLQHLGILVGRRAHDQVWPKIIKWISSRAADR